MDQSRQAAYWRANVLLIAILLAVWFGVSFCAGILFADRLDAISFMGFPLGYWFSTSGSILTFVALTFVYERLMNRLDRRFGVYEQ
jgi:putative solute:sodium symporter small subunit